MSHTSSQKAPSRALLVPAASLQAALQPMAQPSRLLVGFAGVAVVANAMALVTPQESFAASKAADTGRMGAALSDAVSQRERDMAAQRSKLEMRERAVKASEARLAGQVDEARNSAADVAAAGADEVKPDVPYDRLANIYQRMKPARAAPIFEKLDIEVQSQVARRMRDQVTAQIMSNMSPAAAVKLSMALAGRKVVDARPTELAAKSAGKSGGGARSGR